MSASSLSIPARRPADSFVVGEFGQRGKGLLAGIESDDADMCRRARHEQLFIALLLSRVANGSQKRTARRGVRGRHFRMASGPKGAETDRTHEVKIPRRDLVPK